MVSLRIGSGSRCRALDETADITTDAELDHSRRVRDALTGIAAFELRRYALARVGAGRRRWMVLSSGPASLREAPALVASPVAAVHVKLRPVPSGVCRVIQAQAVR